MDPALALTVFAGAASCNIAIEFGCTGPNSTNGMSCASGAIAIGDAFRAIVRGEADVMIAGGAEAPLAPLCFGAFAIIRAMSTRNDDPAHASRPFDAGRDGFVMAEGAAVLVLEERGRALARGAPIYAEICGFGLTNDAHHMTAPRPDGRQAARAIRIALAEARIEPHEVGYINAHGSSTPLNDPTETGSIKQVFGDHAQRLALSGTKGYYGHALGASGAIEAAICALASAARMGPADGQPRDARPRLRPRRTSPARVARSHPTTCSATPSASAASTRRWSSGAPADRLDSRPSATPNGDQSMPSLFRRSLAEARRHLRLRLHRHRRRRQQVLPRCAVRRLGIALAHAMALSVMITATMSISGGHLNPAVTLGLLVARRVTPGRPARTSSPSWSARCSPRCS